MMIILIIRLMKMSQMRCWDLVQSLMLVIGTWYSLITLCIESFHLSWFNVLKLFVMFHSLQIALRVIFSQWKWVCIDLMIGVKFRYLCNLYYIHTFKPLYSIFSLSMNLANEVFWFCPLNCLKTSFQTSKELFWKFKCSRKKWTWKVIAPTMV